MCDLKILKECRYALYRLDWILRTVKLCRKGSGSDPFTLDAGKGMDDQPLT